MKTLENRIILSEEEYIKILKYSQNPYSINKELLKELLNDHNSYEIILNLINKKIDEFYIYYYENGNLIQFDKLTKSKILNYLFDFFEATKEELPEIIKMRYEQIMQKAHINEFIKINKNNIYKTNIDGIEYKFLIADFFTFLSFDNMDIERFIELQKIKDIPLTHFIYAMKEYFIKNKILEEYIIDEDILDNYYYLTHHPDIDIDAINKITVTLDYFIGDLDLSPDIEETIFKNMPQDLSLLEKSIYIYIKMCQIFTYDEEYYAVKQKGPIAEKHKNYNYIKAISTKNNKIVCYEFNEIFGYFLNKLCIHFQTEPATANRENYGNKHIFLTYRIDKFMISADSVTNILNGDIYKGKVNQLPIGLKCVNKNENSKEEFYQALVKVINILKTQNNERNKFADLIEKYTNLTPRKPKIPFEQKIIIFLERIKDISLDTIDAFSYILDLKRVMFNTTEKEYNISITVVRNNIPFNSNKQVEAIAVISVIDNQGKTTYYLFNPDLEFTQISHRLLSEYINNKRFEYISENNPKILNLNIQITK